MTNRTMKNYLTTGIFILFSCFAMAQPKYNMNILKHEKLNRGLVVVKQDDTHNILSWRTLDSDGKGEPFDIYRNGEKINKQSIIKGGTFFIDNYKSANDINYEVKGGKVNGTYCLKSNSPIGYIPIKIQKPADGITSDGITYSYSANDASIGDVDGDGNYEIILKWDPSNSKDNSFAGFTGNNYIDCYRIDGTRLWRINIGKNIRAGAHYSPFIVYDFDGDGKAELIMKTADGTIDGVGNVIGDSTKDYREISNDNKRGRILKGPEYLTVFEGLTGKALKTINYIPARGDSKDWGDDHGNRCERYLAGVGYLDGIHASAIFCRGYYTRTVITSWDWDGKELKQQWIFDTNNPKWKSYAGQGNHNLRIADVDGDGCDEITYGAMCVDHNGNGLYNTGFGHGDAIHLTAFDPNTENLQVWDCHENKRDGSDFRDAKTGKVIFQIPSNEDVGRCMAADIDPTNPGLEMWSSASGGIINIKGDVISKPSIGYRKYGVSTNFGIWWDGDLLRELLDHESITKYDSNKGISYTLQRFEGCKFNNGTKSNPCLSADILGDWREEVLTRTYDSSELRLYVSMIPTDYRINCIEEDIPYRIGVATENVGYNQPPETGFYLGPDKTVNPFLK